MTEEDKAFSELLNGLRGQYNMIRLWDDIKARVKDKGHFREFNALWFLTSVVILCKREGRR